MVAQNRPPRPGRSPFGDLLVRYRTEKGLTQNGLSKATRGSSVSTRSITNYERRTTNPGDWILPHRPTIRALATALSLSPGQYQQLVDAWDASKLLKDAPSEQAASETFVRSGREYVLQQLWEAFQRARNGTTQMVLIGAEAGMGKTSIATYFCNRVAVSPEPTMIAWGESASQGLTPEPYIAVRAAINRLLIPPMAGFTIPGRYESRPELTTARVREILTYLPKLSGALVSDRTIASLAQLHPEIPAETFNAIIERQTGTETVSRWDELSRLLYSLSQDWPVLIVLEDLHWAGDLTISLLVHMLRGLTKATDMPIMIVGTLRSDEIDAQPDDTPGALAKLVRQVEKSPAGTYISMEDTLSPAHGRAFIGGLLGPYPMASSMNESELIDWLYEHTSGQPFLTTEMLLHLKECGALTQPSTAGGWTFDQSMIGTSIPSAISSFIEQRLEHISRRGRALLDVCAILGEPILSELAASMLGLQEDQTTELIDNVLVGKYRLLRPADHIQVGRRHYRTYRFSHALVREYIYATIPLARMQSLHGKAAAALESQFSDLDMATMGTVANHYIRAEDWYGAEMAAYRAAQISVSRLDWDLSEFWFARAEELAVMAGDPRQLWRSRAARLSMLRGASKYDEAITLGARILRQVAYQDWPAVKALTLHHLGEINYDLGELDLAIKRITEASEIHLRNNHLDLAAAASAMLSHSTYRLGQFDVARGHAIQALELSKQLDNSWVGSEALLAIANCEIDLGFYEQALENYQAAIDIAKAIGKLNNEFIPSMNIGLCLTFMGRHEDAIAHLNELIQQIQSYSVTRHTGTPLFYVGLAYEALGRLDEARIAYQRSSDIRTSQPQTPSQLDSVTGLLRVATIDGNQSTCTELLQRIESYISEHTWRGMEYPLLVLISLADAHRLLGNEDRYRQLVREAHEELMHRAALLHDREAVDSYLNRAGMNIDVQQRFQQLSAR